MKISIHERDVKIGPVFRVEIMENGKWKPYSRRKVMYHASEARNVLAKLSDQGRMGRITVPVDERVDATNLREITEQFAARMSEHYKLPVTP